MLAFDHVAPHSRFEHQVRAFSAAAIVAHESYVIDGVASHAIGEPRRDHRAGGGWLRVMTRVRSRAQSKIGSTRVLPARHLHRSGVVSDGRRLIDAWTFARTMFRIAAIPLAHSYVSAIW